jgi:REP element-mobilizing transposase RayT
MKHCALRKGRHSLDGQQYLVTFTTWGRWPLFKEPEAAMAACAAIADARLWRRAGLLAWVLMPDHWHGLIELDGESLSRTVQRLKTNAARRVNLHLGRSSQAVWAPAFHDHAPAQGRGGPAGHALHRHESSPRRAVQARGRLPLLELRVAVGATSVASLCWQRVCAVKSRD